MAALPEPIVLASPDVDLAGYEAAGGYAALAKARAMSPAEVTEELIASELRGRGGAFFATGRKWSFVPSKEQLPKMAAGRASGTCSAASRERSGATSARIVPPITTTT